MTVLIQSLIGTSQTLDSVAIGAFAKQLRVGTTNTLTAELAAAVANHHIQAVDYVENATYSSADLALLVGAINTTTGLTCDIQKSGSMVQLTFTLTAVALTVTDAAASGSSASLKLFDFVQAGIVPIGCRQDYTAFAEGAALTTAAGDAAFVMGLGSVAANAGDGALTSTEVDFGAATATITLSGGTAAATKLSGASSTALDGTATAVDLYLNWSGSAATIDANSTIAVTGSITVLCALLGDD